MKLYVADEKTLEINVYDVEEGKKYDDVLKVTKFRTKNGNEMEISYSYKGRNENRLVFLPSKHISYVVLPERNDDWAIEEFKNFYKECFLFFSFKADTTV